MNLKKLLSLKNVIISVSILILIWQLLFTVSSYDKALFPSPKMAFDALIELIENGKLFENIKTSMYRFVTGYFSSVIVAVVLGLILGRIPKLFQYINPAVQLLRPISPTAWMPFIVLLFGIGDVPAIVIIFIAAFFPVLLSTVSAVGNIDPVYLKVSKNFGIKQPALTWKVIFPAAFPQIANGIHLALGTAWIFLVAGEMVGAQSGLGYQIIDARNNIRADILLATILVIGIIGILLDGLLKIIEKVILKSWGGAA
ncbi:NitT/TauT family transport system permease protein [Ruminococcus albus]|uniref:NitT/TauT family transport system permease protein n=1 Tax=Ruminococcus albus TaxID=1264 RepID=A0A1I1FEF2_RUMAL|nr:NitT/TauT family transport system permease protein [Ruminococcus albus]